MHAHEIIAFHAAEEMFGALSDGFSLGRVRPARVERGETVSVPTVPVDGYMVGGWTQEIVVPRDERLVTAAVEYFARTYAVEIESGNLFVGAWENGDTGLVHVDMSQRYDTLADALRVGKERNELAVWAVERGEEVPV